VTIKCSKPDGACVCTTLAALAPGLDVLILQHPQEQDRMLGTACVTAALFGGERRIGLSWPNLANAWGPPREARRWAVLYLGSKAELRDQPGPVVAVDRDGAALPDQRAALAGVTGIVVLDGTWAQAKTLWWRNPWLLKLRRIVLKPAAPSRYGKLRREPRKEGLSTLEATGLALASLAGKPALFQAATDAFDGMLRALQGNNTVDGGGNGGTGAAG
jgi:hypothetical protein